MSEVRHIPEHPEIGGAERKLTNDIPVNLTGQQLEYLRRAGGRMHEELKGEGKEAESGREIFILSSDGVRWPFGTG